MRLEFLIWNYSQFEKVSTSGVLFAFAQGVRFDLVAIVLLSAPLLLYALLADSFNLQRFEQRFRSVLWFWGALILLT